MAQQVNIEGEQPDSSGVSSSRVGSEYARLRGIESRKALAGKLPSEWPPIVPARPVHRRITSVCPHCGLWHDGRIIRMCRDSDRWTDVERDALRAQQRRDYPAVQFAPSSTELARRLGRVNREGRAA